MANVPTNPNVREPGPAADFFAITPHNTTVQPPFRGIYVGTGGTITLTNRAGTTIQFTNVIAGTILPVQAPLVMSTGTSATGLIGLV